MATSGSPTVRRRRLAAELRRLRGNRTGTEVASALRWSPAKISRYELGRTSFPLDEVRKLLGYYGVTEPRAAQLLALAEEANQRGWWEDFSDALPAEYREFIGLEAEASSAVHWHLGVVPGLLQTPDYTRAILSGYQSAVPTPPSILERREQVRLIRQEALTARRPPLEFSAVIDEAVLLRSIGGREVMHAQLWHLVEISELPNIDVRILPLHSGSAAVSDSFVIFGFSSGNEGAKLGDVVCTESLKSELYVEGETDTFMYRQFFAAVTKASLSPDETRRLILGTAEQVWT